MAPSRFFVTGASGFVGRHLCHALSRRYPAARRMALRRSSTTPIDAWENVIGDLRDGGILSELITQFQPDLVIHLAGQASVAAAARDPRAAWDVNVLGSLALATALQTARCKATLLAVSSAEVYGTRLNDGPCDEAVVPAPATVYGRTKFAAEQALSDVHDGRVIVVRPFNHSGPGQDERFALPGFAAQIARIERGLQPRQMLVGDLSVERDLLHIDDVIAAYVALIEKAEMLPHRAVFVVASGTPVALSDVVRHMQRQALTPFDMVSDPSRLRANDNPRMSGDSSALQQLTGWRPHRSHQQMAADLLDYWRQQTLLAG